MTDLPGGPEPHEPHEADEAHHARGTERPHTEPSHENQPHAGNGTVNHGLDDPSPEGLDSDELALRRILHQAVQEIEPRDGTLEHLKRAVPARRARKRQAAVGMAAAALFIGTAVPALVHVSNATGSDANPSIAGNSSQAQGGTGTSKGPDGQETSAGSGSGTTPGKGQDGTKDPGKGKGAGPGGTADPAATSAAGVPECTPDQLGGATASSGGPDAAGVVYGTFHVVNVSGSSCAVSGTGSVSPLAQGAADPAKIALADHSAGDAAAGLPDPALSLSQVVLAPGSAFDVQFAWVPSETCPTGTGGTDSSGGDTGGTDSGGSSGDTGGSSSPSPDPSPSPEVSSDSSSGTSTGGDTGTATQLVTGEGTADGSVVVSYTPSTGSPTVSATVPNACAGTVYRTGLLAQ
ncbi:hypothetical protein [Streptomyces griseosporeus]|uniref:hypothetical protein n=1 Tax=Streptomyces griseosporeus TaxID=1910 RepID=UPI0036F7F81C